MDATSPSYDPRYLAGVVLFNRGDFFEAHEAWEDVWVDCAGEERVFYQGLIQAAVGL
jgi:predicted metal-dependent hydrolase